jgi:hypothetical protein
LKLIGLTRLAGIWSADPQFQAWLEWLAGQPVTKTDAAEFIRLASAVQSRKELDTDRAAAKRFLECVREPFMAWREGR